MSACLEHQDEGVRHVAYETLTKIAEGGDKRPINMVAARLEDGTDGLKRFPLDFLVQLASKCNRQAAVELVECLDCHDYSQKLLALMALKELSKRACNCNNNTRAGARVSHRRRQ